ncbi:NAD kinase [Albibacterium sp.]|uniref:NAD kinase n=1 Tax=Albibacterium sp. TaxID=2952885 RepID=UPI002BE7ECBC|nr:NAD kinase [Albibacterium sp.]HUH17913.1 NAD kinase [Albibacterium sp.]
MKVAIYGIEFQKAVIPYVEQLFELLKSKNVEIWVYKEFDSFLSIFMDCGLRSTYKDRFELPSDIDFMLSLGGDGTMLSAVSILRDSKIPITGINLGRLGFLASINKNHVDQALELLLNKEYSIEKRTLLSVEAHGIDLFNGDRFALNDVTVLKRDSSAMITVNVYLNGEILNAYWADGIIFATPTGSTAYSLSCGGPIILPGSGNFVITPVSPHNLNVRPLVISDKDELTIEIDSRSDSFLLSCDSRTCDLKTSVKLKITRADFNINLIRLKGESFFSTLRQKLLWGLDTRNY